MGLAPFFGFECAVPFPVIRPAKTTSLHFTKKPFARQPLLSSFIIILLLFRQEKPFRFNNSKNDHIFTLNKIPGGAPYTLAEGTFRSTTAGIYS